MKPIHYRPFKLAVTALLMGSAALYLLVSDDMSFLSTLLGIVMGVGAIAAGACGLDQRPALALDGRSLAIRTTFRNRVVDLADIVSVSVETRMIRLYGLIPIARREFLVICVKGGAFGSQKLRLAGAMLTLPPGGVTELCGTLNAVRGSAPMQASPVPSRADGQAEDSGGSFDPDAAIARYLAQKAANPDPAPAAPPAPPLPGPARATFGRRIA